MNAPVTPFTAYDISALPAPRTVSALAVTASVQLVTGIGLITCAVDGESVGDAPSSVRIHDGTDATGQFLFRLQANQAGSAAVFPAPPGILFRRGIWLEWVFGAGDVSVTYIPLLGQP